MLGDITIIYGGPDAIGVMNPRPFPLRHKSRNGSNALKESMTHNTMLVEQFT